MLSHKTHAAIGAPNQPGQEAQKQYILFDANSASNFSATFEVNTQPWYLQAFNLAENDIVYVQMASGSGSGVLFSNMYQFGGAVQLNALKNKLRIDLPGRYRLSFSGVSVQAIKVTGFPATMTQESNSGFAEALTEIVNTLYTSVIAIEGASPITVTGGGGILDPYVIGFAAAGAVNVTGGDSVDVTGDGSSGNPYVVDLADTIGVGIAPQANIRASFAGTSTASSLGTGVAVEETLGANATGYIGSLVFSVIGTGSGLLQYQGYNVANPFGTGNVPTSLYGYFADNFTKGITNYGFYSGQGAGATNWAFYSGGDARSKFGAQGIVLTPLGGGGTPSTIEDGQMWVDDFTDTLKVRLNGATKTVTVS